MTETINSTLSVADAINSRRSVRSYTAEPVSDADLKTILTLAGRAPSAWNLQPWRFVAVRDAATRAQLQAAAYGQTQVASAPVVLVLYSDMQATLEQIDSILHPAIPAAEREQRGEGIRAAFASNTPEQREAWGAGQSYIALGYLSLAARSLGYDTSLMLGFDAAKVRQLLDLPDHATIPALVALGVAAEPGFESFRHDPDSITRYI